MKTGIAMKIKLKLFTITAALALLTLIDGCAAVGINHKGEVPEGYFNYIKPNGIKVAIRDAILTGNHKHWKDAAQFSGWFKAALTKELTKAGFTVVEASDRAGYDFSVTPEFSFSRFILPLVLYNRFKWDVELFIKIKDNNDEEVTIPKLFFRKDGLQMARMAPMYRTEFNNSYIFIYKQEYFKKFLSEYSQNIAFEMHASPEIGSDLERFATRAGKSNATETKTRGKFTQSIRLKNGTIYQNVTMAKAKKKVVIIKENGETIVLNYDEINE